MTMSHPFALTGRDPSPALDLPPRPSRGRWDRTRKIEVGRAMRPLLQARDKRVRAVELFASGLSYTQIAREVGFSNRGSAHRAVTKGLAMHGDETIETIRTVKLDRLEALHAAHWEAATAGDLQALDIVLKAGAQRRRWYGTVEKTQHERSAALYRGTVLVQPWLEGNTVESPDRHAARSGRQSQ